MDKRDCKLGMFVSVMHSSSSISRNRLKVKRVGKIIGIYGRFVNLILFDYELSGDNVILGKKLYNETFRFSEISEIEGNIDEGI